MCSKRRSKYNPRASRWKHGESSKHQVKLRSDGEFHATKMKFTKGDKESSVFVYVNTRVLENFRFCYSLREFRHKASKKLSV